MGGCGPDLILVRMASRNAFPSDEIVADMAVDPEGSFSQKSSVPQQCFRKRRCSTEVDRQHVVHTHDVSTSASGSSKNA